MSTLITTPYSNANSYVSVDEASVFLSERLYSGVWNSTDPYPDAQDFIVSSDLSMGVTTIPVSGGTGIFQAGTLVRIGSGQYKVKTTTSEGATSITLSAGLTAAVLTGEPVTRLSANQKEAALIWATNIFERSFSWQGAPTYVLAEQALAWPRTGVYDKDGREFPPTVIPEDLRRLTAEFGLNLLQRDTSRLPKVIGTGIKRAILPGPLQADVDTKNVVGLIPPYIIQQLTLFGVLVTGATGFSFASMVRS